MAKRYVCECGAEFDNPLDFGRHKKTCKVANLKNLKEEVEQGSEKAGEPEARRSFQKFRVAKEPEVITKIRELYQATMPNGRFHQAINYKVYEVDKPARFLLQITNDFMTEVREVLKEILDKYKYGRDLF